MTVGAAPCTIRATYIIRSLSFSFSPSLFSQIKSQIKARQLLHSEAETAVDSLLDALQGVLASSVVCGHCGHASVTHQPFTHLSLDLAGHSTSRVELETLIREFFATEQLEGEVYQYVWRQSRK